MSSMQMFIGRFDLADDQTIFPKDDDDFYDMEELHGCHYVKIDDKVYKFWGIADVDDYGFQTVIGPQDGPVVICYWYNGGAGIHEVVEESIKQYLENP